MSNTTIHPETLSRIYNTWKDIKGKYSDAICLIQHNERAFVFENDIQIVQPYLAECVIGRSLETKYMYFSSTEYDNVLHNVVANDKKRVAICQQLK